MNDHEAILQVEHLFVDYVTEDGPVTACADVSLSIRPGEIIGIAGESGSGKSTLLAAVGRLQRDPAVTAGGQILFARPGERPVDLTSLTEDELSDYRWTDISIVMQSAMACLNPVARLQAQFLDVIKKNSRGLTQEAAVNRAEELLELVGMPADRLSAYPHELSGGMQQRSLIALALACDPSLILMDEPTTAVDVLMQRELLDKMLTLQRDNGFAVLFVTHDLSLLLEIADRIAIMYAGRVVEVGTPERIHDGALHPYTRGLRDAFPPLREPLRPMTGIAGTPPDLRALPPGCAFAPRCPLAEELCTRVMPELKQVGSELVACHVAQRSPQSEQRVSETAGSDD
ncbi:ABC transporter ATP-binding protein [Microlunatus sp. GCM10028923]|uniref:ABC transporter ATP-binding protein n=1 Tax=Microlunatus sp. GCM10028923 TaxID=3273400 RepID=UPI0036104D61